MFNLIEEIANIIQGFVPKIDIKKLQLAEIIQLAEKIQLAENININLIINRTNDRAQALITPRSIHSGKTSPKDSIVLSTHENQANSPYSLAAQNVPFESGTHIIINQPSWWETANLYDNSIILGRLKIIPIFTDEFIMVETFKTINPDRFVVRPHENNLLSIELWRGQDEHTLNLSKKESINHGSSRWEFEKYSPDQFMTFNTLPEIVLSFDDDIVKQAILIERKHKPQENEYYVLVLRDRKNKEE